jgi:3-oxoacyl-[acyl-carrier protein] reductase
MDLGIAGRRAAVAAGSAGLGLATAAALHAEGVHVAICGRDADRLAVALDSVAAAADTPAPVGLQIDLSEPQSGARFVEVASELTGGPIDILVCNAGGPPPGTPLATDIESYRRAFDLNCLSSIAMCQAAVPGMLDRRWGRVVAITSIGARQPIGLLAASSVARAAVTSFLKMLSVEVAPRGVTVNSLQPGIHRTDRITSLSGDQAERLISGIPVGRMGEASDFGATAAYLCSEQAGFITGVGLHVDGGAVGALQ